MENDYLDYYFLLELTDVWWSFFRVPTLKNGQNCICLCLFSAEEDSVFDQPDASSLTPTPTSTLPRRLSGKNWKGSSKANTEYRKIVSTPDSLAENEEGLQMSSRPSSRGRSETAPLIKADPQESKPQITFSMNVTTEDETSRL